MAEVVEPAIVYVVEAVTLLGTIGILGVYADETDALREANSHFNRRMTPHEVIPVGAAPEAGHGDGGS